MLPQLAVLDERAVRERKRALLLLLSSLLLSSSIFYQSTVFYLSTLLTVFDLPHKRSRQSKEIREKVRESARESESESE